MPPDELNHEDLNALGDDLGYIDAIWFVQQLGHGSGDYTAERHQWLDRLTLEDIWADIHKLREQRNQANH
jgi:hypothetical protein